MTGCDGVKQTQSNRISNQYVKRNGASGLEKEKAAVCTQRLGGILRALSKPLGTEDKCEEDDAHADGRTAVPGAGAPLAQRKPEELAELTSHGF